MMYTTSQPTTAGQAIEEFDPLIRHLARRLLPKRHVEDAEQQARLGLLESFDRFDPARGAFTKFARAVIRNTLLEMRSSLRARFRQTHSLPDDVRSDSCGGADTIIQKLLNDPDDILPKKKAQLLRLFFATSSRTELAASLGISTDRANERVSRLRRDLRELAAA